MNLEKTDMLYMWHPYTDIGKHLAGGFPVIEKALGSRLIDIRGRQYLDGISSWWCVNLGHGHPHIVNSIAAQLDKVQHTITGGMSHTGVIELSAKLAGITPEGLNRSYFASDGASSVEAAIRIAVQYWWNSGRSEKRNIVSIRDAYHGDTLGAVGLGFVPQFHRPIAHIVNRSSQAPSPHCFHCPFEKRPETCATECFRGMEELLRRQAETTAAVIAEPVCQGAAGIRIYPPVYIEKLSRLCSELDVLLILDEIAVGFGRTGRMFASELAGVSPDLLVLGKSLTGGYLPMSAVVATERIYDSFRSTEGMDRTFYHGHTFSGNPLASAAACAAIDVFRSESVLDKSALPAEMLKSAFDEYGDLPGVHRSTSLGCMSSLEISREAGGADTAKTVAEEALREGLIIRPLGSVLYLWPPLLTDRGDMEEMISIFGHCLKTKIP